MVACYTTNEARNVSEPAVCSRRSDEALLTHCRRFTQIYAEQCADDADPDDNPDRTDAIGADWSETLHSLLSANLPTTDEGKSALACAALVALNNMLDDPSGGAPAMRLTVRALKVIGGATL